MRTLKAISLLFLLIGIPQARAATLTLGPVMDNWSLPSGNEYYHIDAMQGLPSVVGGPKGSPQERSLFMASESGGVMTFGAGMPAMTLWNYETGGDPVSRSIVNDLRHMPNGTPLLIGASTSVRAAANGEEATVWQLDSAKTSLLPVPLGFPNGTNGKISLLVGGNSTDGYAGSNSADPIFVPPTGGGQTLDAGGVFLSGIAEDLDGTTTVGHVEFRAAFWKRSAGNAWEFGTLQLPEWSDGVGSISDIAGNLMGGYLYNPNLDDVVPVLWNTDGTINKVFDLTGYNVSEMIVDHGVVTSLLNAGAFGERTLPSMLYADGWSGAKVFYGDLVPALPNGTEAFIEDISSGGSIFVLADYMLAGNHAFEIAHIQTSVPEPGSIALASVGFLAFRVFFKRKR